MTTNPGFGPLFTIYPRPGHAVITILIAASMAGCQTPSPQTTTGVVQAGAATQNSLVSQSKAAQPGGFQTSWVHDRLTEKTRPERGMMKRPSTNGQGPMTLTDLTNRREIKTESVRIIDPSTFPSYPVRQQAIPHPISGRAGLQTPTTEGQKR